MHKLVQVFAGAYIVRYITHVCLFDEVYFEAAQHDLNSVYWAVKLQLKKIVAIKSMY